MSFVPVINEQNPYKVNCSTIEDLPTSNQMELKQGDIALVNFPNSIWLFNGVNWIPVNNVIDYQKFANMISPELDEFLAEHYDELVELLGSEKEVDTNIYAIRVLTGIEKPDDGWYDND